MFTDTTVLSLYRVILLYVINDREFLFSFPPFSPFAIVLACIVLCIACIGNVFYIGLLVNYNAYTCYYILRIALKSIIRASQAFLYLFKYNHSITSYKAPYGANKRILFIGTYVCMYLFLLLVLIFLYIDK